MSDLREQVARRIHPYLARAMGEPYSVHPEWTEYPGGRLDDVQQDALACADHALALVKAVLDEHVDPPQLDGDNSARGGWALAVERIASACGLEVGE
jgi:hypothetical protein